MIKFFIRAFLLLLSVVAVFVTIGYLLPRDYDIESTIYIESPPDEVFGYVNSLPNWQFWSNFSEQQVESLKITYGDTKSGVGAAQTWTDSRGSGKLWITKSEEPSLIEYSLEFANFPTMLSQVALSKEGEGTRIAWTSEGTLPSGSFYGYSALLFPTHMTYQYEQNLQRLKEIVEAED